MGKIKETRKLYKDTINQVTKSEENWIAFLDSASWNFKYKFTDQILIFAQRPDATACAEMENEWNKKCHRWVNKDANGIFVLSKDENSPYPFRLVFDVSDTHNAKGTEYKLWSVKPEYEQEIIETLDSTFGAETEENSLAKCIVVNAYNMVADNIQDYMTSIQQYKKGTLLENVADDEMFNILVPTVWASVSYMMMKRCGIDAQKEINIQEFSFIKNFESDKIITILGTATSEIAEMGLREIAKTVINLQNEERNQNRTFVKNQKQEYSNNKEIDKGGIENERENRVHESGRLQHTKSSDGERENTKWQIRKNEVALSNESQTRRIFDIIDGQKTEQRIDRSSRESNRDDKTNSRKISETRWSNRGNESTRPNEVDRTNEQLSINSRGTSSEGTNLHLEQNNRNFWKRDSNSKVPIFDDEDTISKILNNAPSVLKYEKLLEVYNKFNNTEKSIEYIKNTLGDAYTEYEIEENQRVGYKAYENGLLLWKGKYLQRTEECFVDWDTVPEYLFAETMLKSNENFVNDFIPTEQEQVVERIETSSLFNFTQEDIDAVLKRGSGFENGKFRIYEQLTKGLASHENVEFLKKEYGIGGFSEENVGWVDYSAKGIKLSKKVMSEKEETLLLTWKEVENRIRELISSERYFNTQEQDEYYDWLDANGIKSVNEIIKDEDYEFAKRLHSYIKDYDLIAYNANFPIENTEDENIELLKADINDEVNIKDYIDFLKASYEDLDYDDEITVEGKALLVELEKRLPNYEFHNGDIVFIGTEEYEIRTINDERAVLVDISFPLITKEMPREEFDKKVKENPANDKLRTGTIKANQNDFTKSVDKETPKKDKNFLEEMFEICQIDDYRIVENDNEIETVIINSSEYSPTEAYKFIFSRLDELDYPFWDDKKNKLSNELHAARQKEKEYLVGKNVELDNELYVIEKIEENDVEEDLAVLQNQNSKVYRVETVGFIKYLLEAKEQEETEKKKEFEEKPKEEKLKANIKHKRRNKIEYFDLHPEVPMQDRHNFKIQNNDLGIGTKKEKYRNNIEAIKTLKLCEEQNRYATPEEQEILSKYVGWGGLQEAFDSRIDEWNAEYKELKSLLTEKEYENASKSVLTAFYTPPIVIKSIYKALENMGLQRGNILEPSCRNWKFYGNDTRYISRLQNVWSRIR